MDSISLDDALKLMEKVDPKGNPVPFSITAVTCDIERNKGGERLQLDKAVLCKPGNSRKAYHNRNDARNIKLLTSDEIRAIHPILITHINGKKVII